MQEIDATGIEGLPMSHAVNGSGDISHSSVRSGTMLDPALGDESGATIEQLLKRRGAVPLRSGGAPSVARIVEMIAASPGFTTRRAGSVSPLGSMP
jgi:hypothetical protein